MESARDKAIRLLGLMAGPWAHAEEFVDAIIEAARSSESAHTRAMQRERELDARGTTGGKATTETIKP